MKIVLCGRKNFYHDAGGDTVQISAYHRQLAEDGVDVQLSLDAEPDLRGVDLVHCFNIQVTEYTFRQIDWAKRQGRRVVFSPIYWSMDEFFQQRRRQAASAGYHLLLREIARQRWDAHVHALQEVCSGGLGHPGALKAFLRLVHSGKMGMQQKCLALSDLILVSAPLEKERLSRDFKLAAAEKIAILPNGVDELFYRPDPEPFYRRTGLRDYVLAVGRMEPHKNQLAIVQAVRDLPFSLVLIGSQRDPAYLARCQREAGSRTLFLDPLPHLELASAYAGAKAHVLASWFDIPGLVNLEAALAGCNIVSTNRGSAIDYLGSRAWYVRPDDVNSIRQGIQGAMATPKTDTLSQHIAKHYTWPQIGRQLKTTYERVLGGKHV